MHTRTFRNHLWYLIPEAVVLTFFDNSISIESKRKMLLKLIKKIHYFDEKIKLLTH
jgi:hypothetical protein